MDKAKNENLDKEKIEEEKEILGEILDVGLRNFEERLGSDEMVTALKIIMILDGYQYNRVVSILKFCLEAIKGTRIRIKNIQGTLRK